MAVATTEDVSDRLGRSLNPDEELTVTSLLEDAEVEIEVRGGHDKLADPVWRSRVIKVECDMVLRAAKLSAKVTGLVPNTEFIDQGNSDPAARHADVFLTRQNRRTLGMRLNGSVNIGPIIEPWGDC